MTVEEMKAVDIRTVDRDTLVDIRDVKIDRSLPLEEHVRSFVEQIKNPYCFRCGDAVVKTSFLDTDVTLEDCVESYLRNEGIVTKEEFLRAQEIFCKQRKTKKVIPKTYPLYRKVKCGTC